MSWAWAVPTALTGVGVAVAAVMASRIAATASALQSDLRSLAELRPALVEARDEMSAAATELRRLRGR